MIIDFHTHIFPPQIRNNRGDYLKQDPLFNLLYADPAAKLASAEDLIAIMDNHHIDMSVVLNIAWHSPELCRLTNEYILEAVSRYSSRLVGFGMFGFDSPEMALTEIERCAAGGIKGIGEFRPSTGLLGDNELLRPLIEKIIDRNLILLIHCSEPLGHVYPGKGDITPERLYPFIKRFPKLKLVCAHWGGGLPFYMAMPEVKKALENVFFDSAASPFLYRPQIYSQVMQSAGMGKILFGSDYPVISPGRLLKEIEEQNLPPEAKKLFLGGNAGMLLGID
jgi:uncharacterized protein